MELEFFGAAGEVTGSSHILRVAGRTVLLDCGLFQGRRAESHAKNIELPLPVEDIDAVILSHAHIDHAGRLPLLVKRGYHGPIFTTPPTRDLVAVMLADSAHIQVKDAEFLRKHRRSYVPPLYEPDDVPPTIALMKTAAYGDAFNPVPCVRATFSDAGHILGSASVLLECEEGARQVRVAYSGDIGRKGLPIIGDPVPPHGADLVLMESTYGNREHPPAADMRERLAAIVRDTAKRGGRVLIPAFAVGRTQDLIYDLHALVHEGRLPPIPIIVDSPLATQATDVFAHHAEVFRRGDALAHDVDLFEFPLLHFTTDVTESKALNERRGPMVIISASGMAETGRILHHLINAAPDSRNTILIVGFQAEHTLGRRIVERQPMLRILGVEVPLHARVEVLNGYSAHADRNELRSWLDAVSAGPSKRPRVELVHGEQDAREEFAASLRSAGYGVDLPSPRGRVSL